MNKQTTFVSFIGSRGSGKTTVADQVDVLLHKRSNRVLRQHQGLVHRFSFSSLWNAIYLWRYFDWEIIKQIGFCGRTKRRLPSLYRLYLPLAFAHDLSQLKRGRMDVLIYDSNVLRGMMQAVSKKEIDPDVVRDFYQRKILPRVGRLVLVIVETDPETAIERWIARDKVELNDTEKNQAITERQEFQKSAGVVVNALSTLNSVTVVRLDGSNDPSENAGRVVENL